MRPFAAVAGLVFLAFALSGCEGRSDAVAAPAASSAVGKTRSELNVGYSLLHQQAIGIPKISWLLMFKSKRPDLDQLTSSLIDDYRRLAQTLEDLAGQYPALRLDVETMPVLLAETRKAIGLDLAKDIAPLIGNSGATFERELLLMFYNALDEQRHLVGVMIEREPDPGLKKFLQTTRTRLDARRVAVGDLLEHQYFRATRAAAAADSSSIAPRSEAATAPGNGARERRLLPAHTQAPSPFTDVSFRRARPDSSPRSPHPTPVEQVTP